MSVRSVSEIARCRIALAALLLTLPATYGAGESLADSISRQVEQIYTDRSGAVVRVEARDSHGNLCGTGFFADPAGTVFTLAATVAKATEIWVVHGERRVPAKLLLADPRSGVALLKTDLFSPFIPIGDSKKLQTATPVMAIGFSTDQAASPSFGLIGGFDRQFLGKYFVTTHIRAIMPVKRGYGGSPLMNMAGEAIGILIAGIDNGTACYALPIEAAEKIRVDYTRFGEARHGWVGVEVEEEAEAVAGSHARVVKLAPDTPAAQSGLQAGDILLQISSVKISSVEDILDASYFLTAGDQITMKVFRNGETVSVNVRSTEHPATSSAEFHANGLDELQALAPDRTPTDLLDGN